MLRIAIQKSGRLHDESIRLLRRAGIGVENGTRKLKVRAKSFPLEVLYLRNSDMPKYIEDGVVDIGIIGENAYIEQGRAIAIKQRLGFSQCRLSLAVPKEVNYSDISFFEGQKIATSYPNTLQQFLDKKGVSATIHKINGSVEVAPSLGLAVGICDLVSSGNTLFTNGLKEVEVLLESEAILVARPELNPEKSQLLEQLLFRFEALLRAQKNKYILLNAPNEHLQEIINILPGLNSPTVMPLAKEGWSSLHSVITESDFWERIEALKAAGAEGILVTPIEKMIA